MCSEPRGGDGFQNNFPARMADIQDRLELGTPIEIRGQDEARIGQKNTITWRWARRGIRPIAPRDQRTQSADIFGAICPERGVGAGWVLPHCDTRAMPWHLNEISSQVEPRRAGRSHPRSGGMADHGQTENPAQQHALAAASMLTRT